MRSRKEGLSSQIARPSGLHSQLNYPLLPSTGDKCYSHSRATYLKGGAPTDRKKEQPANRVQKKGLGTMKPGRADREHLRAIQNRGQQSGTAEKASGLGRIAAQPAFATPAPSPQVKLRLCAWLHEAGKLGFLWERFPPKMVAIFKKYMVFQRITPQVSENRVCGGCSVHKNRGSC